MSNEKYFVLLVLPSKPLKDASGTPPRKKDPTSITPKQNNPPIQQKFLFLATTLLT